MNLCVVTPVGPGHENVAVNAARSVNLASTNAKYLVPRQFSSVRHEIVHDANGDLGRSRARNIGIDRDPAADWYFFLDADDSMCLDALAMNDMEAPATFGAVSLDGMALRNNVWPCGWRDVALRGALGTLSMGFFCRADIARELRFNEEMDRGEDFDFYMRLPGFTKRECVLVEIGRKHPSAGGPRGYARIDWVGICNGVIAEAVEREPGKYDLRGHAVLAKAGSSRVESRPVSRAVR